MRDRRGFTLIELLLVVAIIAILSAIAVPNFLESQVRAKAARARSDMRTLGAALEAYRVDANAYPSAEINGTLRWLCWLTTPIAYTATKEINDPFTPRRDESVARIATLRYYGFNGEGVLNASTDSGEVLSPRSNPAERLRVEWFMLFSHGPNGVRDTLECPGASGTFVKSDIIRAPERFIHFVYDSTNGTRSPGEIFRPGGSPTGATAPTARLAAALAATSP